MAQKTEYRNAVRSKKLIKQAFVELMQEKDKEKITVMDIVNRADINRGTFYSHFASTYAVEEQIQNEILSSLLEFLDEFENSQLIKNPLPFLLKIARFLEKDLEFYRLLMNTQSSYSFLEKFKLLLMEKIMSDTETLSHIQDRQQFNICVNFFTSGIVGVYRDWFNKKIPRSLDDITLIFNQIIISTFQTFIS